jgi:hypothetical protein
VRRQAPVDVAGRKLKQGDVVRVVGVPDLSSMAPAGRRETLPVFRHLVGTYKRIAGFDRYGHAELWFRIRAGRNRGLHWVAIEPFLLRRRRAAAADARSRRYRPGRSSTGGGA